MTHDLFSFSPSSINPSISHSPCALCLPPSSLKFPPEKVKRADTGVMFHLAGYPAFSSLDQSHLWLIRQCVWDTVATVRVHLFPLVWASRKDRARWSPRNIHKSNQCPCNWNVWSICISFSYCLWQLLCYCSWSVQWGNPELLSILQVKHYFQASRPCHWIIKTQTDKMTG